MLSLVDMIRECAGLILIFLINHIVLSGELHSSLSVLYDLQSLWILAAPFQAFSETF